MSDTAQATDAFDVIVIGGGPAGESAAGRCADRGFTVALVERELRRLADRELEALRDWLPTWRAHTEAELLERWFADAEIGATLDGVAGAVRADADGDRGEACLPDQLFE